MQNLGFSMIPWDLIRSIRSGIQISLLTSVVFVGFSSGIQGLFNKEAFTVVLIFGNAGLFSLAAGPSHRLRARHGWIIREPFFINLETGEAAHSAGSLKAY